jgi:multiple sugar transport system permease protein
VPYQVTFIPAFLIIQHLGLMDTHEALYLPNFLGGAFGTFLLRQFFKGIPRELSDAAYIDGCNSFDIYWRIMLPIAKPALATLGVFTFMWSWNDLIGPAIYLSSPEKMTLTIGLASFQGLHATRWDLLMAGSTLSVIPILIVYVLAQKYFVRGITVGGLKG